MIEIKEAGKKGRGVFATKNIPIGKIIEVCPVVVFSKKDKQNIDKTLFYKYYFAWPKKDSEGAVALGFGSLYNHSFRPNAVYIKNINNRTLTFKAIIKIKKGQEITVNYNGNPKDKTKVDYL